MALLSGRDGRRLELLLDQLSDSKSARERLQKLEAATRDRDAAEARARQALADLQAERMDLEARRAELIAEERAALEEEKAAWRARVHHAIHGED